MIAHVDIRLARPVDAATIARMSRDDIEYGLGWRWTPSRVRGCMRDRDTSVVAALEMAQLVGFGIMHFMQDEAHLLLLDVDAEYRRQGIGRRLVEWLELTAVTAGIGTIYLESRVSNRIGREFYRCLGYRQIEVVNGFYRGHGTAVRLGKDLWRHG